MLIGKHVCLRTLDTVDSDAMRQLRNSPEIWSQFQSRHFINDISQSKFLENISESREHLYFVAETLPDRKVIGYFFVRNIDHRNQRGENGVFLASEFLGSGVEVFEAAYLLLNYEFFYLNLRKIHAEVLADNKKAIRFNEALGMQKEGTLIDHLYYDGHFHDLILFAMFREDFQQRPAPIMRSFASKSGGGPQ